MGLSDTRVLSRPMTVVWDGWETTTTRLQQAGWEISAEQCYMNMGIRLALRNQRLQMYGITSVVQFDFYRNADQFMSPGASPVFHVVNMASRLHINIIDNLSSFRPIDAMPQVVKQEIRSIEDLGIFATPLVRTEEIIVEPHTVEKLMEQIKSLQAPEQAAIRARNRLRESRDGTEPRVGPRQKFHAQILSIA
jgi:hypothetical protein